MINLFKSARDKHLNNLDEENLYAIAADEISRGALSVGLYAKALAESNGNETVAKAKYIKLRVEMLRVERAAIIEQANFVSQESQKEADAKKRDIEKVITEKTQYPNSRGGETYKPPEFSFFAKTIGYILWALLIAFTFYNYIFKQFIQ